MGFSSVVCASGAPVRRARAQIHEQASDQKPSARVQGRHVFRDGCQSGLSFRQDFE
jgi:hypothetical protein